MSEFDGLEYTKTIDIVEKSKIDIRDPNKAAQAEIAIKLMEYLESEEYVAPTSDLDLEGPRDFNDGRVTR